MSVALALLGLVVVAAVSIVWTSLAVGISPMPTTARVRSAMFELLPPVVAGEVHELGAGWGTLAVPLAERYPGSKVVAWEASWVPFAVCWLRVRLRARLRPRSPSNLVLRRGDFFEANLAGAGLVTCYLFPGAMARLAPKFDAELPRGAVVLSNTFGLRGRAPSATRVVADLYRTQVFRYDWGVGPLA